MRPLVADYIETLKPYVPGKPIEETAREYGVDNVVKLASNENPLGPSPLAVKVVEEAARRLHYYPDGSSYELLERLASFLGLPKAQLFAGHGSNEIIELLIRTFTTPDDEALLCQGSFVMYKVALQSHGRKFREVPMKSGYRYDLEAMAQALSARTRIVFLANPDNPTGTAFSSAELKAFMTRVSPETIVVLDEAYKEYVTWADYPDGLAFQRAHKNVVVLRTFSKIYGLAGVRLGYGIMHADLAAYLQRTRMPFNLSSLAQAAGVAALDDVEHVRTTQETTWRGLRYLEEALRNLGLDVPSSHANFVFAPLGRPAIPVYEALLRRGIITRPMGPAGWDQALRISAGLRAQNERVVNALAEVLR